MGKYEAVTGLSLSNRAYDLFNNAVTLLLPALGVFYATIAALWNLGYVTEIVGTIAAVSVLGGVVLKMSNKAYNAQQDEKARQEEQNVDGVLRIMDSEDGPISGFKFADPEVLEKKSLLKIKVENTASQ